MLLTVMSDALFAVLTALGIIYALTFSFYCIFLSDGSVPFSLAAFVCKAKKFDREEK